MDKRPFFADMHTHTSYSHDGGCTVTERFDGAIENGLSAVAVTEHCDMEFYGISDVVTPILQSVDETEKLKSRYKDRLICISGIELGESVWHKKEASEIPKMRNFDVILGSVHAARYKDITIPLADIDFSAFDKDMLDGYIKAYYEDVYETVNTLDCDVYTHFTVPLLYTQLKYGIKVDLENYCNLFEKIFKTVIDRGLALEVNTKRDYENEPFFVPDEKILKMYYSLGGRRVTLGSDAHTKDVSGKNFGKAAKMLKSVGFKTALYYEKRKPIEYEL